MEGACIISFLVLKGVESKQATCDIHDIRIWTTFTKSIDTLQNLPTKLDIKIVEIYCEILIL